MLRMVPGLSSSVELRAGATAGLASSVDHRSRSTTKAIAMPAGQDFSSEPTPRRKRSRAIGGWLALVVPSIVSVLVLMVALGFLVLFTPVERPAAAADRQRIVDIHAVAAQIDDYRPDAGRETFRRHEYFDRSFELDYSYAPGKGDDLAMNSTLTVAATTADAERLFRRRWGLDAAARTLSGGKDLRLIERNDIFHWGDQSRLGVLIAGGKPVGNLFVARRGRTVFYLLVSGACFDSPEAFSSLVLPTLRGKGI
ncbi:MAG: hypothetical protein ACLQLG_19240 [Thermoguttaceae bacterium]